MKPLQGPAGGWRSLAFLLGLAVVLLALYWPAASLQGVFYVGDIYRLGYPARLNYAQALQQGRLPLWTPDALAGYPLFAEGQTGACYPLNLLLYRWLPLPVALNYSVLLAFWLAGAGTFAYARSLGLRRGPAFLAGCTFMLGGFLPGHLNHLNMLSAVAWLPLLLWAVEQAGRRRRLQGWAVVAALFGLQGLAGHPQISLLSGLLALAQAGAGPLAAPPGKWTLRRQSAQLLSCAGALGVGATLAMVQWAPTYELTRLSQRGHGLDSEFFTSFSLHPAELITLLWPFLRGNPFPQLSLETMGYVGALPLLFAVLAPLRRRSRPAAFWGLVAIVALLLSLGRWNPAYLWLSRVPVLNMFRAPARYLLWFNLAVAILAAVTADSLLSLTRPGPRLAQRWGVVGGLLVAALGGVWVSRASVDDLVADWRWLPVLWLAATASLLAALRWRPPRRLWLALAVGLLLADLSAFNGVYNRTYNAVMPPADFARPPDVLRFLAADSGSEPYRVYTQEEIVPVLSVMRESLYPNIQLLHGVASLNGYYPLVPAPQQWLMDNLDARLADLLNVRYVLIPQLLPVDEESEFYDTEDPFAPSIVGRRFDLTPQRVAALEVEGYLSHSADLADDTPVAQIVLRGEGGQEAVWTLRAGRDLAEWAYLRDDVAEVVRHRQPSNVVRIWPGRSGLPPRDHPGQTYLARHTLAQPLAVGQIEVRPLIPRAYLRLERLRLIDPSGAAQLLSSLVGEGDHVLVYRSPDVVVYRNEGAGPRAFLVHRAHVVGSMERAAQLLAAPCFSPWGEAVLQEGRALAGDPSPGDRVTLEEYRPEYVRLRVATAEDAYLVLADSDYPGWKARLDGAPVEIRRANVALRAVAVPPGEHVVEFLFLPQSWLLGLLVSGLTWAVLAGILLLCRRRAAGRD